MNGWDFQRQKITGINQFGFKTSNQWAQIALKMISIPHQSFPYPHEPTCRSTFSTGSLPPTNLLHHPFFSPLFFKPRPSSNGKIRYFVWISHLEGYVTLLLLSLIFLLLNFNFFLIFFFIIFP